MKQFRCVSIITSSNCQLRCKNCPARDWMRENKGFQTSLNQVEFFINRTIASGYHFKYISLTGGEPLLWDNLMPALVLLRKSGISDEISMNTNLMWFDETKIAEMKEIASMVDVFVISEYPANKMKIDLFVKNNIVGRNGSVEIKATPFTRQTQIPIEGTLPAACRCVAMALHGSEIDACVGMRFLCSLFDMKIPSRFTTKVEVGYAEKLDLENLYMNDLCKYCISNANIIKYVGEEPWRDGEKV